MTRLTGTLLKWSIVPPQLGSYRFPRTRIWNRDHNDCHGIWSTQRAQRRKKEKMEIIGADPSSSPIWVWCVQFDQVEFFKPSKESEGVFIPPLHMSFVVRHLIRTSSYRVSSLGTHRGCHRNVHRSRSVKKECNTTREVWGKFTVQLYVQHTYSPF